MAEVAKSEHWLAVPGWPGYEWSDLGRVRSIERTLRDGRTAGGVVLKQTPNSKGYPCVTLSDGWRRKTIPVYKLVKLAHTGPSRGRQIRHLDDDKLNSAPANLKYGDRKGRANWKDRKRNRERKEGKEKKRETIEIGIRVPGSVRLFQAVSGAA